MNAGYKEINWVASEIEKKFNITKKGDIIRYDIDEKRTAEYSPSYYDQIDILEKMDTAKAIEIKERTFNKDLARDASNEKGNSFIIEIFHSKFSEFCQKYKDAEDEVATTGHKKLSEGIVAFEDDEAVIKIGDKKCSLPPYKNEHYFARAMFNRNVNEFVDWSIIYEEMTGGEPANESADKRTVQDTMYRVNNRIKKIIRTENDLFTWRERAIKRNF